LISITAVKLCAGAIAGLSLAVVGASPLAATTPDRSWIGIKRILIVSQLTSPMTIKTQISAEDLCRRVQTIASAGAPVPVSCATLSDPDLRKGDTAVLAVQAAVAEPVANTRLLIFTIRKAEEKGLEPAPVYFSSTPRAVPISDEVDGARLDQELRASLGQLLPWLSQSNTNFQPRPSVGE
jgi:hypothetical protein